jgi:uroporphyrinogen-III decarboxylase
MAPCCPRPFERLQFLRGTENVMMDMATNTNELFVLLDKIHRFYLREVELWAGTEVDGIMFMDDWGSQQALLIHPSLWRDRFKPLYKQYIGIIHAAGKKAFMHSDGWITDIIPDLIELGLDALNAQVFCMDLEELGSRFKGQITFWGEIDRQNLLPNAQPDQIKKAVQQFNRCFYNNGGIIGQLEFGPGAKPDNVYAAFEAWDDFSVPQKQNESQ